MPIYAWPNVRLHEHSRNTAAILLALMEPELTVAAKRLGISREEILALAAAAAILHDTGKAAREYQQTINTGNPSFYCHELLSSWITLETLEKLTSQHKATIAAIAVLRHHHGMRSLAKCLNKPPHTTTTSIDYKELAKEIAEIDTPLARQLAEKTASIKTFRPLTPKEAAKTTINKTNKLPTPWKAAATILTGTLALADYLAATLLDNRTNNPQPKGYAKEALKELAWRTKQQEPNKLKEKGLKQLKTLKL